MNVVIIPYHDWRKIEMEGARTRDSHIIHHIIEHPKIQNVIILNRPISFPELLIKKRLKAISGDLIFKTGRCCLYQIGKNAYVVDYLAPDLIGPFILGKKWFFNSYGEKDLKYSFKKCLEFLSIKVDAVLTQNVFSDKFCEDLELPIVFDAWDNFVLFPENRKFEAEFKAAYMGLAESANVWITNSLKNVEYYNDNYHPKSCHLIKNGVDIETFSKKYDMPADLASIQGPIVGFGGKITHLFDYNLFNYVANEHRDKSFVILGQILDKNVFNNIAKQPNIHYLGDKHYKQYSSYVTNFDVGIIPYVTDKLEHGADSIKVYEYIAAGLSVVGTLGAGMGDMKQYIHLAQDRYQFAKLIHTALGQQSKAELPEFYTWKYKTNEIIELISETI